MTKRKTDHPLDQVLTRSLRQWAEVAEKWESDPEIQAELAGLRKATLALKRELRQQEQGKRLRAASARWGATRSAYDEAEREMFDEVAKAKKLGIEVRFVPRPLWAAAGLA
jgi:hypothetical protein